jgi:GTP-binding protein Era
MQRRVERELVESDAVLLVLNGEQGVGPGDRFIADALLAGKERAEGAAPVVCVVNKIDILSKAQTVEVLSSAAELSCVDSVFPISARTGEGLESLVEHLSGLLPEGPLMYPAEDRTDEASELHLAELIREQVLRRTHEEVPHAVEVAIQEIERREDGITEVHAQIWTETESQKAILIGKGGRMVRDVGTAARTELERELGGQVYLDLRVRVRESWRRDDSLLDRLGIE